MVLLLTDFFLIVTSVRCNPADQDKAIVKYTNGSSVTSKIRSRTKVRLECEKGYDYYRNEQPMKTPLNRRCVKGNIQSAPVCKEGQFINYPLYVVSNKAFRHHNIFSGIGTLTLQNRSFLSRIFERSLSFIFYVVYLRINIRSFGSN